MNYKLRTMNYKLLTVVRCLLTLKKEINHLNYKLTSKPRGADG